MVENPKDRKKEVWQFVLTPMLETFPAPTHLRADAKAREQALRLYETALMGYDDAVLKTAWEQVGGKNELWCWPTSGELANACRAAKASQIRAAPTHRELSDRAQGLAQQYVKTFMKRSRVAGRAKAEGWEGELKMYVFEVAWVQAQFLVGMKDIGWDGMVLRANSTETPKSESQQAADFLRDAKIQATKGVIRVHVPHSLVERCKAASRESERESPNQRW